MAESSLYPLFSQQQQHQDTKYSTPPSTAKTSLYESESPLGAHSSTTSSRLSGSYEPSQVSSIVDDLNSDMAQMKIMGDSATSSSQRPYLPGLVLPSNMPPSRPNPIHATYNNFHSYPNYYPVAGSPVLREHPTYSYGPMFAAREQHHHAQPSFPSPIHYTSPPPVHTAPYQDVPRRASVGVYYNYEYGANAPLSPISPYGYHHGVSSPPMMFMPTPQPYPASPPLIPAPVTRQVRYSSNLFV